MPDLASIFADYQRTVTFQDLLTATIPKRCTDNDDYVVSLGNNNVYESDS